MAATSLPNFVDKKISPLSAALVADIKRSTEFEQGLNPEEVRTIVDVALKLMIEAVQHQTGIFRLFSAPVAHEPGAIARRAGPARRRVA